jgi:hypothetical protein
MNNKTTKRLDISTSETQFNAMETALSANFFTNLDEELSSEDYSLILGQLQRLDAAIHKEYTLVSDRMSWMVTSESFIFTAFIIAAVNYTNSILLKFLVGSFLILMPLLGIFLAGIVKKAIDAAHSAADNLKEERDKLEKKLPEKLRIKPISSKVPEHSAGNLPPMYLPFVIIGVWAALFLVTILTIILTKLNVL